VRLRPATREERQLAWLWGVLAAASLLLRPFWLLVAPLLPPCPFRALTGIPCLTCGTTHAAVAMLRGDLAAALAANPLAAAAGLMFLTGGVLAPLWALFRGRMPVLPAPLPLWVRAALVVALLATWVWVIVAE